MKFLTTLLMFTWLFWMHTGCSPKVNRETTTSAREEPSVTYDSILAQRLGADDYGMKKYVMAFLKVGPNRNQDSTTAAQIQRGHMDNIMRLANEGKLVLAGPFLDKGELRGIFIFNVETVEEARILTETDPAIQSGRLVMELHPWYGSAATMMINEWHGRLQKKKM